MSDKTLLNEATVRRFMKLAEMAPLTNDFVNELYAEEAAVVQEDEAAEEAVPEDATPAEADFDEAEFEAGEEAGEEETMDDLDVDLDMEGEADEDSGELTLTDEEAEVFLKVADKVRAAMDAGPAVEELPVPDMGGDEEMEADVEVPEPAMDDEPPAEEEVDELDVELEEEVDNDALVQEIARRVAKRLLTDKEN